MKRLLDRLDLYFEKTPDWIRRHRLLVGMVLLLAIVLPALSIPRISIDMTLESYLKKDDPIKVVYDRFRETFSSDDVVYIVYEAKDGDVLSASSLNALYALHQELEESSGGFTEEESSPLDHLTDVTSLINVSYLEVQGDTLYSRDFVGSDLPKTAMQREQLRRQALAHPDYPQFYISQDSRFGGILIRTDFGVIPLEDEEEFETIESDVLDAENEGFPEDSTEFKATSMEEYADFNRAIEQILQKPQYEEAFHFYAVGNPPLMGFVNDVILKELNWVFLGTISLIMLTLWFLFRSFSAVVWPLLVVVLSVVMTCGLIGWLGLTMTLMINVLILLLIVVGIADVIHILSGYLFFRRQRLEHAAALRAVYRKSGLACLLTSVTTSMGLLSLVFVPIVPIRDFGLSAAIGVMLAFFLTIFMLPLMLDLWSPVSQKRAANLAREAGEQPLVQKFLDQLEPLALKSPWTVVLVFLTIAVVSLYGLTQVKIETNLVSIFKEGLPIRQAYQVVDRYMGGANNMEIYIDLEQADALRDPQVLKAMEHVQHTLETKHSPPVVQTASLVDVVKSTFKALNEDREEMFVIPENEGMLQQTLFMFETANPDDRQLLVPDDYSQGRISVRVLNAGSMEYVDFMDQVKQLLERTFSPLKSRYPTLKVEITGNLGMMMKTVDYISRSQIQSFSIALGVVSLLLLVVFGSIRVGLLAMIPNVLPIVVTFGVMGFFDISLDVDTLIITPLIIGISVDDTIHFLTHYRAEVLQHADIKAAIRKALKEAGQAISFTSLVLITGFLFLIISSHQGLANFGILSAVAIGTALIADLILLPAFCQIGNLTFGQANLTPQTSTTTR